MKRIIKFRAWNKKSKKMYEVLHLNFNDKSNGVWANVKGFDIIEDKDILIQIQPENIEVMQFTGLLDTNGKEIYEGDLVKTNYGKIGEVVFHTARASYIIHDTNHFNEKLCDSPVVVIGNIYENTELI